jgi:hypothetical protein
MQDSCVCQYDNEKIQEYMNYYNSYYGSDFRPDQGLDEITDMIFLYSLSGTWIDLGGGTSTFIWLPAFKKVTDVHSVDKYPESGYVQTLARSMSLSGCYKHILIRYSKSDKDMRKINISYSTVDLINDFTIETKYNNVSQFGLLGLCQTKQEYLKHLNKLSGFMDNRSIFLGANWVFSSTYTNKHRFANSYLDTELIEEYASNNAKKLLFCKRINIVNDPCYDAVLVYAFTQKT